MTDKEANEWINKLIELSKTNKEEYEKLLKHKKTKQAEDLFNKTLEKLRNKNG